ncbi:MAG TPA: potassium channel family protein [Burkholderiales bacterium]|nr:potassium channel family protein [Burkholderiales bacterium]
MPYAVGFAALLVVISTLLHYEALRLLSTWLPHVNIRPRARLLGVIFGVFVGHLLEIACYALAYYCLHDHFGLGGFGGKFADNFAAYFYFSAESYTSIGLGDIYPLGSLRLITGVEALNGLLLVGWSASFTYLAMQRYWNVAQRTRSKLRKT